jgi:hypothetical protein
MTARFSFRSEMTRPFPQIAAPFPWWAEQPKFA